MSKMVVSPRSKGGKFKKIIKVKDTPPTTNRFDMLLSVVNEELSVTSPASKSPRKRRCDDISSLRDNNCFSERYAEETSKQHVINSRGLTHGTPYKRFKRALLAVSTRNGFYTDFDGVLWEKRPNGESSNYMEAGS